MRAPPRPPPSAAAASVAVALFAITLLVACSCTAVHAQSNANANTTVLTWSGDGDCPSLLNVTLLSSACNVSVGYGAPLDPVVPVVSLPSLLLDIGATLYLQVFGELAPNGTALSIEAASSAAASGSAAQAAANKARSLFGRLSFAYNETSALAEAASMAASASSAYAAAACSATASAVSTGQLVSTAFAGSLCTMFVVAAVAISVRMASQPKDQKKVAPQPEDIENPKPTTDPKPAPPQPPAKDDGGGGGGGGDKAGWSISADAHFNSLMLLLQQVNANVSKLEVKISALELSQHQTQIDARKIIDARVYNEAPRTPPHVPDRDLIGPLPPHPVPAPPLPPLPADMSHLLLSIRQSVESRFETLINMMSTHMSSTSSFLSVAKQEFTEHTLAQVTNISAVLLKLDLTKTLAEHEATRRVINLHLSTVSSTLLNAIHAQSTEVRNQITQIHAPHWTSINQSIDQRVEYQQLQSWIETHNTAIQTSIQKNHTEIVTLIERERLLPPVPRPPTPIVIPTPPTPPAVGVDVTLLIQSLFAQFSADFSRLVVSQHQSTVKELSHVVTTQHQSSLSAVEQLLLKICVPPSIDLSVVEQWIAKAQVHLSQHITEGLTSISISHSSNCTTINKGDTISSSVDVRAILTAIAKLEDAIGRIKCSADGADLSIVQGWISTAIVEIGTMVTAQHASSVRQLTHRSDTMQQSLTANIGTVITEIQNIKVGGADLSLVQQWINEATQIMREVTSQQHASSIVSLSSHGSTLHASLTVDVRAVLEAILQLGKLGCSCSPADLSSVERWIGAAIVDIGTIVTSQHSASVGRVTTHSDTIHQSLTKEIQKIKMGGQVDLTVVQQWIEAASQSIRESTAHQHASSIDRLSAHSSSLHASLTVDMRAVLEAILKLELGLVNLKCSGGNVDLSSVEGWIGTAIVDIATIVTGQHSSSFSRLTKHSDTIHHALSTEISTVLNELRLIKPCGGGGGGGAGGGGQIDLSIVQRWIADCVQSIQSSITHQHASSVELVNACTELHHSSSVKALSLHVNSARDSLHMELLAILELLRDRPPPPGPIINPPINLAVVQRWIESSQDAIVGLIATKHDSCIASINTHVSDSLHAQLLELGMRLALCSKETTVEWGHQQQEQLGKTIVAMINAIKLTCNCNGGGGGGGGGSGGGSSNVVAASCNCQCADVFASVEEQLLAFSNRLTNIRVLCPHKDAEAVDPGQRSEPTPILTPSVQPVPGPTIVPAVTPSPAAVPVPTSPPARVAAPPTRSRVWLCDHSRPSTQLVIDDYSVSIQDHWLSHMVRVEVALEFDAAEDVAAFRHAQCTCADENAIDPKCNGICYVLLTTSMWSNATQAQASHVRDLTATALLQPATADSHTDFLPMESIMALHACHIKPLIVSAGDAASLSLSPHCLYLCSAIPLFVRDLSVRGQVKSMHVYAHIVDRPVFGQVFSSTNPGATFVVTIRNDHIMRSHPHAAHIAVERFQRFKGNGGPAHIKHQGKQTQQETDFVRNLNRMRAGSASSSSSQGVLEAPLTEAQIQAYTALFGKDHPHRAEHKRMLSKIRENGSKKTK